VGSYLKDRGATVSAFYLSNVEQYLRQDGKWSAFCRNSAALPLDETSVFIRPSGGAVMFVRSPPMVGQPGTNISTVLTEASRRSPLFSIAEETANCGVSDTSLR